MFVSIRRQVRKNRFNSALRRSRDFFQALESRLLLSQVTWVGLHSANLYDPENWDDKNVVFDATTNLIFASTGAYHTPILVDQTKTVGKIEVIGPADLGSLILDLNGKNLTIQNSLEINGFTGTALQIINPTCDQNNRSLLKITDLEIATGERNGDVASL